MSEMSRSRNPSDGYAPLLGLESGDEDNEKESLSPQYLGTSPRGRHAVVSIFIAAICLAVGFAIGLFLRPDSRPSIAPQGSCQHLNFRHEWRSLGKEEKGAYLRAVQCLRTVPSRLGLNQTLYDDFPHFHARTGEDGKFSFW